MVDELLHVKSVVLEHVLHYCESLPDSVAAVKSLAFEPLGNDPFDVGMEVAKRRVNAVPYVRLEGLVDELDVDRVVLGGISLGTNVSLLAAAQAPERVRGLVLEMPVLETAAPAAALTFVPLLLQVRYAQGPLRVVSWVASRLPSSGIGPLDSVISTIGSDPDEISAVLRGIGPPSMNHHPGSFASKEPSHCFSYAGC